jgi:hypothetical protein
MTRRDVTFRMTNGATPDEKHKTTSGRRSARIFPIHRRMTASL